MAGTISNTGKGHFLAIDVTGAASTDGGGVASILNPEGVALHIVRTFWKIATGSTGGADLNAGIAAATDTDASDLISALSAATPGTFNGIAQVVAAKAAVGLAWGATSYLNLTGSATTAGLVGTFYVEYIRA